MDNKYVFVIPALNPDEKLLQVIRDIQKVSNNKILVLDDGSAEASGFVFDKITTEFLDVVLLKHAVNLGKGAALKTAFNHILTNYHDVEGVVTLDCDGQHSSEDCLKILNELQKNKDSFVLGVREFSRNIPLKSYVGNKVSNLIYRLVLGRKFQDTQTGLRGLSKSFMTSCLKIQSNQFEFETEQLVIASRQDSGINTVEIPIRTIYIENNQATSFRPLVDSFRIYFILFRYGTSSLITAAVDFIVFVISLSLGMSVIASNLLSRTASIFVQFTLLNQMVFFTKAKVRTFLSFVVYVYLMGIASAWLQIALQDNVGGSEIGAKISIEFMLFFINFAFLRVFLFQNSASKPTEN